MEFERITLTITGRPIARGEVAPEKEVEALAGKGTGLAFHRLFDEVAGPDRDYSSEDDAVLAGQSGYIVTQVCSGLRLGPGWVDTPRQAKRWIELLAGLADWNKDIPEVVKGRGRAARLKELAAAVEQARLEAIDQCLFVENY